MTGVLFHNRLFFMEKNENFGELFTVAYSR